MENILIGKYLSFLNFLDSTSEDIILEDSALAFERSIYFKAATLPAQLRRLTTLETTCNYSRFFLIFYINISNIIYFKIVLIAASEIYAFLLRFRKYVSPFDLMNFLIKRFSLTSQDVEEYTDYIVNSWHSSSIDVNTATTISSSASSEHSTTTLHELFNDKSHIIGPQVFL